MDKDTITTTARYWCEVGGWHYGVVVIEGRKNITILNTGTLTLEKIPAARAEKLIVPEKPDTKLLIRSLKKREKNFRRLGLPHIEQKNVKRAIALAIFRLEGVAA